ncbi:hypothetical protein [Streptococcus suis]|uniref:hypothetical protein n=1 Tax=Streptococcus suis TaxID=1307 RepID=UPI000CF58508|nr:hypothetical protein [Streptococcus suis]HEM6582864.1 hypothetical protein [Streptococcus suis]
MTEELMLTTEQGLAFIAILTPILIWLIRKPVEIEDDITEDDMKFWNMIKKFLSVEEEDYIPQSQHELEGELANARLIDELRRRIDFLENVNKCQAELLADREV